MKFFQRWWVGQSDRDSNGNNTTIKNNRNRWSRFRDGFSELSTSIKPWLPPVNYITVHYAYFIIVGLVFTLIFWGSSAPSLSIGFWDGLFLTFSALTSAGLNTVNVSSLSTGQQVILAILLMLGNPILISIFTLVFRMYVFEKRFKDVVEAERDREMKTTGTVVGMAGAMFGLPIMSSFRSKDKSQPKFLKSMAASTHERGQHTLAGLGTRTWKSPAMSNTTKSPPAPAMPGGGPETVAENGSLHVDLESGKGPSLARSSNLTPPSMPMSPGGRSIKFLEPVQEGQPSHATGLGVSTTPHTIYQRGSPQITKDISAVNHETGHSRGRPLTQEPEFNINSFLRQNKANIGRNGQFYNLTVQQREYLGGVEYRAIKLLILTVTMYFILWQLLGAIALGVWIAVNDPSVTKVNMQDPWWTGVFLAISAFNNGGLTLLDAGIAAFQSAYFLLIVTVCLMLAGSAAFPVFLRLILWTMAQMLKYGTREEDYPIAKETLDFTLKYPRRVYTMLFPSRPTWYLAAMLAGLVVADWVALLVLSIGSPDLDSVSVGQRVFDRLFQSISLWSGGFSIISPSSVYFDLQVLWMAIMYLETYPGTITMRNSNVYEERSLGIYAGDDTADEDEKKNPGGVDEAHTAAQTLLAVPPGRNDMPFSPTSAFSHTSNLSTRSVKKLANVGRRGTAFVGRQIQKHMIGFQGVGINAPRRPGRLQGVGGASRSTFFTINPPASSLSPSSNSSSATITSLSTKHEGEVDLVSQHVRSQLSHDVWWIALATFVITIIETKHSIIDPETYSVFNMMFEVVSAYTNIGLSLGLPDQAYSFSGGFYTGSKVVMVLVMLRGRHRGLPVALDRAVRLPKEQLDDEEEEDAEIRRAISRDTSLRSRIASWRGNYQIYSPFIRPCDKPRSLGISPTMEVINAISIILIHAVAYVAHVALQAIPTRFLNRTRKFEQVGRAESGNTFSFMLKHTLNKQKLCTADSKQRQPTIGTFGKRYLRVPLKYHNKPPRCVYQNAEYFAQEPPTAAEIWTIPSHIPKVKSARIRWYLDDFLPSYPEIDSGTVKGRKKLKAIALEQESGRKPARFQRTIVPKPYVPNHVPEAITPKETTLDNGPRDISPVEGDQVPESSTLVIMPQEYRLVEEDPSTGVETPIIHHSVPIYPLPIPTLCHSVAQILPSPPTPSPNVSENFLSTPPETVYSELMQVDEITAHEMVFMDMTTEGTTAQEVVTPEIISEDVVMAEAIQPEVMNMEEDSPEETAPVDMDTEEAIPVEIIPETVTTAEVAPKETVVEAMITEDAPPIEIVSGAVTTQVAIPAEMVPTHTIPSMTLSGNMEVDQNASSIFPAAEVVLTDATPIDTPPDGLEVDHGPIRTSVSEEMQVDQNDGNKLKEMSWYSSPPQFKGTKRAIVADHYSEQCCRDKKRDLGQYNQQSVYPRDVSLDRFEAEVRLFSPVRLQGMLGEYVKGLSKKLDTSPASRMERHYLERVIHSPEQSDRDYSFDTRWRNYAASRPHGQRESPFTFDEAIDIVSSCLAVSLHSCGWLLPRAEKDFRDELLLEIKYRHEELKQISWSSSWFCPRQTPPHITEDPMGQIQRFSRDYARRFLYHILDEDNLCSYYLRTGGDSDAKYWINGVKRRSDFISTKDPQIPWCIRRGHNFQLIAKWDHKDMKDCRAFIQFTNMWFEECIAHGSHHSVASKLFGRFDRDRCDWLRHYAGTFPQKEQ
ncbi:High-affinity potassium transport protein [Cytospora mali]|uniref:High-affinity potassium transport protein n=1 Tax=Cytospora mali TaxID=578113 RepID=A0A194VAE7_CYTMA|nr:High-affinity potassium transport protein [Valsa mali var. pyri (nom. inval.)]